MYLDKPNDRFWVLDIETESLTPDIVWVCCLINALTGEEIVLTDYEKIREKIDYLLKNDGVFITHNGLRFDIPALNRITGTRIPTSRVVDTFVLSQLYNPSLAGGHSLESWGMRLRLLKGEFKDFSHLSDEMIKYCLQDCRVTRVLWTKLTEKMRQYGQSELGCQIEHDAWWVIKKQMNNGFQFNAPKAEKLFTELKAIEQELTNAIYHLWPPTLQVVATYKRPFRADGEPSANYQRHLEQFKKVVLSEDKQTYDAYDLVAFDIGSPQQRLEKLMGLGWKPVERTKSGKSFKVTNKGELVPSLVRFLETTNHNGAQLIADWMVVNTRSTQINTWLEAYNEETKAIHGNLYLANTLRYRHSSPNTANIPAIKLYPKGHENEGKIAFGKDGGWAYEARDLWTCKKEKGRVLLGVDAKGIQLRVLAHYLNNPEFTKQLLEGDPHEYNRQLAGIATRATAKTFIYAFLLGAGDELVGAIVGGTTDEGREIKERFIRNFPGLQQLLGRLQKEIKQTKRITLCDNSKILVTQPHAALGYLLQGDESRIMKKAKVLVDRKAMKLGLDFKWQGDIHDEWQIDIKEKDTDKFIEICQEAFGEVTRLFSYKVPLECDSKLGLTWAETH